MAAIVSVGTASGPFSYTQEEVFELAGYTRGVIRSVFENCAISRRTLTLEANHKPTNDPQFFSDHYKKWVIELGAAAADQALKNAKLSIKDIDYLVATSCTGYLCPGLSQVLAEKLGLPERAKTSNLVGMGCNAAVPALERASEFAQIHSDSRVLVVASEICSATYWVDDHDLETAVGNSLFSDGASAAVVTAKPQTEKFAELRHFRSHADRAHLDYMGFTQRSGRLRVRLDRKIPEVILPLCENVARDLMRAASLGPGDIHHWIVHPGGKKILEAAENAWDLEWKTKGRFEQSWRVLNQFGNMSSATILFVLEQVWCDASTRDTGLMLAMGPGLSVEGVLLDWLVL